MNEARINEIERLLSGAVRTVEDGFTHEKGPERQALEDIMGEVRRLRLLFTAEGPPGSRGAVTRAKSLPRTASAARFHADNPT